MMMMMMVNDFGQYRGCGQIQGSARGETDISAQIGHRTAWMPTCRNALHPFRWASCGLQAHHPPHRLSQGPSRLVVSIATRTTSEHHPLSEPAERSLFVLARWLAKRTGTEEIPCATAADLSESAALRKSGLRPVEK